MNVFTVLVNDGVEQVTGVFVDKAKAISHAEHHLLVIKDRISKHKPLEFAEDDADSFATGVVFSRSAEVPYHNGEDTFVTGVIVQELPLTEGFLLETREVTNG